MAIFQKGFTLIELMVVVAIVGTLAMIAVPNMTSLITEKKVVNSAVDIRKLINMAKNNSLQKRTNNLLCLNASVDSTFTSTEGVVKVTCNDLSTTPTASNVILGTVVKIDDDAAGKYYIIPDVQKTVTIGLSKAASKSYIYVEGSGLMIKSAEQITDGQDEFYGYFLEGSQKAYLCTKGNTTILERVKSLCA